MYSLVIQKKFILLQLLTFKNHKGPQTNPLKPAGKQPFVHNQNHAFKLRNCILALWIFRKKEFR